MGERRPESNAGEDQEEEPALARIRELGIVVALVVAAATGWRLFQQGDLFQAALRGGAAWAGVMTLWLTGCALCARLLAEGTETAVDAGGTAAAELSARG